MFVMVCYLLSWLPMTCLYWLSNLWFIVLYYGIGYRRQIVRKNLEQSFPDWPITKRKQFAKAFYRYLCDVFWEQLKALTITPKQLAKVARVRNSLALQTCYKQGQSLFLWAGHLGNWEWVAHAIALQTPYGLCANYQPLHVRYMDHIALLIRTRFDRKVIQHTHLFRYVLTYHGPPQAVALLIDQAPLSCVGVMNFPFLGKPTPFSLIWAKLARRCNWPVYYVQIERTKRGDYTIVPVVLVEEPKLLPASTIMQLYIEKLEQNILKYPSCWLWSHQRWQGKAIGA